MSIAFFGLALANQPGIGVNPNLLTRWKRELEDVPAKAIKGS